MDALPADRSPLTLLPMTTPAPTPPKRDGAATRQKLIRAALELFTTIGFRATTTPEIASRAEVAEGTIYRHFSGKEDLLLAAYREAQAWGLEQIRGEEAERTLPPRDRLLSIAKRLVGAGERDPAMTRMLLRRREEHYLDDGAREGARQFREALQQIVASGKSDGLVRPGPADLWTSVWLALVAFAAERVSAKEWTPDHPQVALTLEAAWDAISTAGKEKA
jgi:AcrR family transcriptional regulator